MNCEKFANMLDNYADLSAAEIAELEAHAELCESCAADLTFIRSVLGTLNSLPPIDTPIDFLDSVNARLDAELDRESPIERFVRRSKPYVYRYGSLAACVAIAAAVGVNAELLISRMNNDGNDIVIEERTTVNDAHDDKAADGALTEFNTAEPVQNTAAPSSAPAVIETVKPTQKPAAKQTTAPANGAVRSKRTDSTPYVSQNSSKAEASVPSNRSEAPAKVTLPKASSAPQPSDIEPTKVNPTPEQKTETNPPAETAAAAYTDAPKQENIPAAASYDAPAAASYSPAARTMPDDKYAAAPAAEPTAEAADEADYSIAYHEMDNFSDNVTAYAPLSSMISVKAKDAERVRELVEVFISGAYGDYYMITAEDMNHLLGQFDREGIWYSANITESGNKVSFRIVTI